MGYYKPYISKGYDLISDLIDMYQPTIDAINPTKRTSRNQWIEGKDFKPSFIDKGFNVSYNGGFISENFESADIIEAQYTVEFLILTEKGSEQTVFDSYIQLMMKVFVYMDRNPDSDSGFSGCDFVRSMVHEIEYIDNDDRFEIQRSYGVLKFETVVLNFEGVLDTTEIEL